MGYGLKTVFLGLCELVTIVLFHYPGPEWELIPRDLLDRIYQVSRSDKYHPLFIFDLDLQVKAIALSFELGGLYLKILHDNFCVKYPVYSDFLSGEGLLFRPYSEIAEIVH